MTSTFSGLYVSLRSMQAQQLALETAAHNVANAETEGFSRQRAVLAATTPWPEPSINSSGLVGQVGTGVQVTHIERLRDTYLDVRLRSEISTQSEWTSKETTLKQVEVIFQEPTDTGLNTLINDFWNAWEELSENPESTTSAVRTTVVETSASLADALQHTMRQLQNLSDDIDSTIKVQVNQINSLASQINSLNGQIKAVKVSGFQPNDLMDQRDMLLDDLAEIIDFKVSENDDGTIDVCLYNESAGGYKSLLVDGRGRDYNTLTTAEGADGKLEIRWEEYSSDEPAASDSTITNPVAGDVLGVSDGAVTREIGSGELKGLFESRDQLLGEYSEQIDTFARNLIEQVNTLHQAGYDLSGNAGIQFFTGTGASDIKVNPLIDEDVTLIAAASAPDDVPGDGSNALAISNLDEVEGICEGTSFSEYYRNLIARLGVDTDEAQRMVDNQEALVEQLKTQKASVSGVSTDEELAHMIEYQHVYEASARFLSTFDSLLDTLINRMAW